MIPGKIQAYLGSIGENREDALFQPDDIDHVRPYQESEDMLKEQSTSPLKSTATRPPAIPGDRAQEETLAPVNDTIDVVGNGSDAQSLQMLNTLQALPRKKKKMKIAE